MQSANCLHRQPIRRIATISRFLNIINALFLIVVGAISFLGAVLHPLDGAFEAALLSLYTVGFGGILLRYELRIGAEALQRDCGFLFTFGGRSAFLILMANLCWTCGILGFVGAVVTNINAALNVYLLISHPVFTSGELTWTTIEDLAVGGETFTTVARDPAAVAQSARGGPGDGFYQYSLGSGVPPVSYAANSQPNHRERNDFDEML